MSKKSKKRKINVQVGWFNSKQASIYGFLEDGGRNETGNFVPARPHRAMTIAENKGKWKETIKKNLLNPDLPKMLGKEIHHDYTSMLWSSNFEENAPFTLEKKEALGQYLEPLQATGTMQESLKIRIK